MPAALFCTTLYEAGRPYLAECLNGLRQAAAGQDAAFVFAIDGFSDPQSALSGFDDAILVDCPPGSTPAEARNRMIAAAASQDAAAAIFVDMDDVLLPDCVPLHQTALAQADISYGDAVLVDAASQPLGRTFFQGAEVPDHVSGSKALLSRNFMGLSNTAARLGALRAAQQIPHDIVAADWWLWTALLDSGFRAARTSAPVVLYRLHQSNVLGAAPTAEKRSVLRRIHIMQRHFQSLPPTPERRRIARALKILAAALPDKERRLEACSGANVWYQDISRMMGY